MTRSVDASNDRFLAALASINGRLARAQREVSTGKRIATPSDDPDSIGAVLQVRAELGRIEQCQTNLSRSKTEVDAAESAVQSAVKLFDRVRSLAMTGASGNNTAMTRQGIAGELKSIIERFAGLANTEVDGRYIFSGDSDQTHAYAVDFATQTPPWGSYLGTSSTRKAMHPTGVQFDVALTASEIFDNADPAKNAMQAIETLRQALLAGDEPLIQSALGPLAGVSAHLNAALMFYGGAQSQLADGMAAGETLKVRLNSERAQLEDSDATAAIIELQSAAFQQKAALQVRASTPRTSLFEYLK
jgi:flagellar hook-associated protein 3 FlgL